MKSQDDDVLDAIAGARPSGSSSWVRVECPFCTIAQGTRDKKRSFGVNLENGYYHCFRCGIEGRIASFETWSDDDLLAPEDAPPPEAATLQPPQGYTPLWCEPALSSLAFEPAYEYLLGTRGVSMRMVEEAQIGASLQGSARSRVIVPVFASNGCTWLGHVGRDFTGSSPLPYLYPREMSRGIVIYEERILDIETDQPAYVVEGVFDAIPYRGRACALLGKPSRWQIERLSRAKRPVAIVLDGDAHEEGFALALTLRMKGQRAGSVRLPAGVDPDEVDGGWLEDRALACIELGIGDDAFSTEHVVNTTD